MAAPLSKINYFLEINLISERSERRSRVTAAPPQPAYVGPVAVNFSASRKPTRKKLNLKKFATSRVFF